MNSHLICLTNRKSIVLFFMSFLFLLNANFAQKPLQKIRGKVIDADNQKPLVGATITLLNTSPAKGTTTNENGFYRLFDVPVGRYQMQISYLGYESILIPEVLVQSGKEFLLDIELHETSAELTQVVVSETQNKSSAIPASIETITVEQTLRFPATFFDPARLATSFAGVANDNDQANNIVIRGNSPNTLQWRLEGAEIVNPNHLSNAGTFNDRPTQSGGGVNILSTQLLGTSDFLTGAFPANFGHTIGGVMDMNFRKGNNEQHEFMGQIGLIGIEAAAEGPLTKNKGASYLINYRYSFTGLLALMGITFGGEDIRFQDLAVNLNLPTKKWGNFTLFGMGGKSQNVFETTRDTSTWEFQKDQFDINFDAQMGAVGLTHVLPFGDRGVLKTSIIASALENERNASILDVEFNSKPLESDLIKNRIISFATKYIQKLSNRNRIHYGIAIKGRVNSINIQEQNNRDVVGEQSIIQYQPYLSWQSDLTAKLKLVAGLHYNYIEDADRRGEDVLDQSIEPRASLRWNFLNKQYLSLAYGLHSQSLLNRLVDISPGAEPRLISNGVDLTKAHHIVLGYKTNIGHASQLKAEIYYQSLFNVPVGSVVGSTFSALNAVSTFPMDSLINSGTGENYGLEITFQKYLTNNYYILTNASLYESKYTGIDGVQRNTRFNGNYIFNLTAGKEFVKTKNKSGEEGKEKTRTWGLNARIVYLGGFRDTPIDKNESELLGITIYNESENFSIKQKDYFKIDFRVYYKVDKLKYNSSISLDLQNASGAENVAYSYYDTYKKEIVVKNQLGLIPVLSYRIEF